MHCKQRKEKVEIKKTTFYHIMTDLFFPKLHLISLEIEAINAH